MKRCSVAKIKTIPNFGEHGEQLEFSYISGGIAKWDSHFVNLAITYKVKDILIL